jgi:AraC-like DNA-binding protein
VIRFGLWSAILSIGAVQGIVVGALLLSRRENRTANRLLAALIVAYVLHLAPYIIGYAGFYDAYPWLSFAPFSITLVYGPLLYLYVARVTTDRLPQGWYAHLLPGLVQLTYLSIIFVQPLPFKNAWDARVHEPLVDPVESVATYLSLGLYLAAAFGCYARYRRWLRDATTDRDEAQLRWLGRFLVAFAAMVLINAGWDAYSAFVHRLNYFAYFPLYIGFALLVYLLGLEGWRHAGESHPQPRSAAREATAADESREDAQAWLAAMRARGLHRDGELTLAKLATLLDMPAARITRIVNDGLGQNFSEAINRLRVEELCAALADPAEDRSLLDLAFAAGFRSKASFNRAFRAVTGQTPTAYRKGRCGASHLLSDA